MSTLKINSLFHSLEQEFDRSVEFACVRVMESEPTFNGANKVHSLIERQRKIQKKLWAAEREILMTFDEIETIKNR